MPTIARFAGIEIRVYLDDHPPPHIHARYAEHEASVAISTGRVHAGSLPARQLRLVQDWVHLNREDLEENWTRARNGVPLNPV
ncbi:MAG: DUF4160 domain-containing protein [Candidatus Poribacteria bacterium]|nr:DUF4160 domain-containing protein [Candidatus Poribacteria bacterium]